MFSRDFQKSFEISFMDSFGYFWYYDSKKSTKKILLYGFFQKIFKGFIRTFSEYGLEIPPGNFSEIPPNVPTKFHKVLLKNMAWIASGNPSLISYSRGSFSNPSMDSSRNFLILERFSEIFQNFWKDSLLWVPLENYERIPPKNHPKMLHECLGFTRRLL